MAHTIKWEKNGVRIIFKDSLVNEDYTSVSLEITSDPRFKSIKYIIRDYLDVDNYSVESDVIRIVAQQDANYFEVNPELKVAIISEQIIITGLSNMYASYFETKANNNVWKIEVFKTIRDAENWLSI